MKNFPLIIGVLWVAAGCLTAQAQSRNFKFGVKAGANLSSLRGDGITSTNDPNVSIGNTSAALTGFVGGVFLRLGSGLYLQPELLLSQKGGSVNVFRSATTSSGGNQKIDLRFTNLDVPLLVGIRVGDFFRINAGPVASLRLSDNGGLREALDEIGANSIKDSYKTAAWGYQVGVGVDIGNLSLDARYEGSGSPVLQANTAGANFNSQLRRRGSLFQVTAGFAIF